MNVKKVVNNKECSGYEKVMFTGQLDELLDVYTSESRSMPLHLLNNEWQRSMYCTQRDSLQSGEVQMVIDYAKKSSFVLPFLAYCSRISMNSRYITSNKMAKN